MAPEVLSEFWIDESNPCAGRMVESAWETQASWRHRRFGAKSAPQHRDFAPVKEEVTN